MGIFCAEERGRGDYTQDGNALQNCHCLVDESRGRATAQITAIRVHVAATFRSTMLRQFLNSRRDSSIVLFARYCERVPALISGCLLKQFYDFNWRYWIENIADRQNGGHDRV